MSLMVSLIGGDVTGATVQVPALTLAQLRNYSSPPDTIYSGVKFDADGNVYRRQANGGWSNVGSWLLKGTNSDYYLVRTIDSGSLTTDAGAGPLQLNADRIYDIQSSTPKSASVTFTIENVGTTDLDMDQYTFTVD